MNAIAPMIGAWPKPAAGNQKSAWPAELVVVCAGDQGLLAEKARALADSIERAPDRALAEIAANQARSVDASRLAIVARDHRDLVARLRYAAQRLAQGSAERIQDRSGVYWFRRPLGLQGSVAFVFPGEGSQYAGMLRGVVAHFPEARAEFELAARALAKTRPEPLLDRVVFSEAADRARAEAVLHELEFAVLSVVAAQRALLAVLRRLGVEPGAVVGHSSGEFGALVCSGACAPSDERQVMQMLELCSANASELAQSGLVPPAVLVAVGAASREAVEEVVAQSHGRLAIAMDNCPRQVVLAGDETAAAAAIEALSRRIALCETLPWRRAYHTHAFRPATATVAKFIRSLRLQEYQIPLWSCATARLMPNDRRAIEDLAIRQWHSPVRFRETVEAMHAAGVRIFVEVGPRGNLCSFVSDTLGRKPHVAIPMDLASRDGLEQLCHAVGLLAAHHVPLRLEELYLSRAQRPAAMRAAGHAPANPKNDEEATPARASAPAAPPSACAAPATCGAPQSGRHAAMIELQRSLRLFLKVQQAAARALAGMAADPRGTLSGARPLLLKRSAQTPGSLAGLGSPEPPRPKLPLFIARVLSQNESRLVAECVLDVCRHRFLRDHTFFGRGLSVDDPALDALVVVPMAISLEILAQAATLLFPGLVVRALREAQTRQWLFVEEASRVLRVTVERRGQHEARALLHAAAPNAEAYVEAVVEFSSGIEAIGQPWLEDPPVAPFARPQSDVYGKILFSGPAFQTIERMETCGALGSRAALQETACERFVEGAHPDDFVLPVSLIDSCGQIGIFSLAEATWTHDEITMTFPNFVERIEFAARHRRAGRLAAVTHLTWDERHVRSAVEMRSALGEAVFRAAGRVEEIVRLPGPLWRYQAAPRAIEFNRHLEGEFAGVDALRDVTLMMTSGFSAQRFVHRLWARVFSCMILSAQERQLFQSLAMAPVPAVVWLLGRSAAKDAVRGCVGGNLCMADVVIGNLPDGRPTASLRSALAPLISIAHKPFAAVAAAVDAGRAAGVGVDLEPCTPRTMDTSAQALSQEEIGLVAEVKRGEAAELWPLAIWTAKEAAAKATGGGAAHFNALRAVHLDNRQRRVDLLLQGDGGPSARTSAAGRMFSAFWRRIGKFIVTVCATPE